MTPETLEMAKTTTAEKMLKSAIKRQISNELKRMLSGFDDLTEDMNEPEKVIAATLMLDMIQAGCDDFIFAKRTLIAAKFGE
jgi:hypothetical protein